MTRLLASNVVAVTMMTTATVLYQLIQKNPIPIDKNSMENQEDPLTLTQEDALTLANALATGKDVLVGAGQMIGYPSNSPHHPQPTCVAITKEMYGNLLFITKAGQNRQKMLVSENHESMMQCLQEKLNLLYQNNQGMLLEHTIPLFLKSCDDKMQKWCDEYLTRAGKKEFSKIISHMLVGIIPIIPLSPETLLPYSGGVMLQTTSTPFGLSIRVGFDPYKEYTIHDIQQATIHLIDTIKDLLPKSNALFIPDGVRSDMQPH